MDVGSVSKRTMTQNAFFTHPCSLPIRPNRPQRATEGGHKPHRRSLSWINRKGQKHMACLGLRSRIAHL